MQAQNNLEIGENLPPPVALFQMASGYWVSQAIYVAARLGIADLLKDGPRSYLELAEASAGGFGKNPGISPQVALSIR